jgi:hypothetical protein
MNLPYSNTLFVGFALEGRLHDVQAIGNRQILPLHFTCHSGRSDTGEKAEFTMVIARNVSRCLLFFVNDRLQ